MSRSKKEFWIIAKELVETVVRWEYNGPGFFPRIRLDISSGNNELDKLVLKTMAIKGQEIFNNLNKNSSRSCYIAVKWQ